MQNKTGMGQGATRASAESNEMSTQNGLLGVKATDVTWRVNGVVQPLLNLRRGGPDRSKAENMKVTLVDTYVNIIRGGVYEFSQSIQALNSLGFYPGSQTQNDLKDIFHLTLGIVNYSDHE